MDIEDSQFNAYFSTKSFASILPPVILMILSGKQISISILIIIFTVSCALGQTLFTLGLQSHNQSLCIYGRIFIGFSDTLTIQ